MLGAFYIQEILKQDIQLNFTEIINVFISPIYLDWCSYKSEYNNLYLL